MRQNISDHVKDSICKPIDDVWRVIRTRGGRFMGDPAYGTVFGSIYTPVDLGIGLIVINHLNEYGRF